jgi:hypothetical protein
MVTVVRDHRGTALPGRDAGTVPGGDGERGRGTPGRVEPCPYDAVASARPGMLPRHEVVGAVEARRGVGDRVPTGRQREQARIEQHARTADTAREKARSVRDHHEVRTVARDRRRAHAEILHDDVVRVDGGRREARRPHLIVCRLTTAFRRKAVGVLPRQEVARPVERDRRRIRAPAGLPRELELGRVEYGPVDAHANPVDLLLRAAGRPHHEVTLAPERDGRRADPARRGERDARGVEHDAAEAHASSADRAVLERVAGGALRPDDEEVRPIEVDARHTLRADPRRDGDPRGIQGVARSVDTGAIDVPVAIAVVVPRDQSFPTARGRARRSLEVGLAHVRDGERRAVEDGQRRADSFSGDVHRALGVHEKQRARAIGPQGPRSRPDPQGRHGRDGPIVRQKGALHGSRVIAPREERMRPVVDEAPERSIGTLLRGVRPQVRTAEDRAVAGPDAREVDAAVELRGATPSDGHAADDVARSIERDGACPCRVAGARQSDGRRVEQRARRIESRRHQLSRPKPLDPDRDAVGARASDSERLTPVGGTDQGGTVERHALRAHVRCVHRVQLPFPDAPCDEVPTAVEGDRTRVALSAGGADSDARGIEGRPGSRDAPDVESGLTGGAGVDPRKHVVRSVERDRGRGLRATRTQADWVCVEDRARRGHARGIEVSGVPGRPDEVVAQDVRPSVRPHREVVAAVGRDRYLINGRRARRGDGVVHGDLRRDDSGRPGIRRYPRHAGGAEERRAQPLAHAVGRSSSRTSAPPATSFDKTRRRRGESRCVR